MALKTIRLAHALTLTLVLTLLFSSVAFAYIPPSEFLVRQFIKKRSDISQVWIKSLIVSANAGSEGSSRFYEVLSLDLLQGKGVSKILSASGAVIGQKSVHFGQSESGIPEVFFSPNYSQVSQQFRGYGIALLNESEMAKSTSDQASATATTNERYSAENLFLKRDNRQLFWVIGPMRGSTDEPSMRISDSSTWTRSAWFLKDQFVLSHLYSDRGRRGQLVGYRFDEIRYYQEFPFPRRTEVLVDGRPLLKMELTEMKVITKGDKAKGISNGIEIKVEELVDSGTDEIDGLIRTFWKTLR